MPSSFSLRSRRRARLLLLIFFCCLTWVAVAWPKSKWSEWTKLSLGRKAVSDQDPRLAAASRTESNGWIYVRLEGPPTQIGFQHGYLLAGEIDEAVTVIAHFLKHTTKKDWSFYKKTAEELFWPQMESEYKQEIDGMAAGLAARGKRLGRNDLLALNGWMELGLYYLPSLRGPQSPPQAALRTTSPANCSAFIATGDYTKDGLIVMGHNAWVDYVIGQRWNIVMDIKPQSGHRIFMDTFPGFIHSGDDFVINSAGLMVTETTITQFYGFDPQGTPEFMRARKAIQYAGDIDQWIYYMREKNNGGYANDWLIGDRKTGEIARLELALKNTPVWRTKNGYYVGSNFASDPKVLTEETRFNPDDETNSANARRIRWEQLMAQNKGKIDIALAKQMEADHYDTARKQDAPSCKTLCGHNDLDDRGAPEVEWEPFYPGGGVQGKVTDSRLAEKLQFWAIMGHPCGRAFDAKSFLAQHAPFKWQRKYLRDMPGQTWTLFSAKHGDENSK